MSQLNMTAFSSLLEQVRASGQAGIYEVRFTPDWMQGRAAFGGLSAALTLTALRQHLDTDRPLRALMTAFIGPPASGLAQVECQALRSGKSVSWAQAALRQNDQVCTTISACLGHGRDSSIRVDAPARPQAKDVEGLPSLPYLEGLTPVFTQHFDMRWGFGGYPMSGGSQSECGVWVRFRQPQEFNEAHVVALMDVLPPAVAQMQRQPKPLSSMSWHLEMLDDMQADDARDGQGWWFVHMYAHGAANGYSQQHATLYTPAGRALAMSQQSVAVFA